MQLGEILAYRDEVFFCHGQPVDLVRKCSLESWALMSHQVGLRF